MTISESQLETWSNPGAVKTAKATHESIRAALERFSRWPHGVHYDPYLQGSYRNHTNIRGDSDVDLVVQLNTSFRCDISALSAEEQTRFWNTHVEATYKHPEFRNDAITALKECYAEGTVNEGNKCLKVTGGSGRLAGDVVVCLLHLIFKSFPAFSVPDVIEGMTFYIPSEDRWVVNYPKLHLQNGENKNSAERTNGHYKPAVRMFKNARGAIESRYQYAADSAPSYFIECLLYNVPDGKFAPSHQQTYVNLVNWLRQEIINSGTNRFMCQNEQVD